MVCSSSETFTVQIANGRSNVADRNENHVLYKYVVLGYCVHSFDQQLFSTVSYIVLAIQYIWINVLAINNS